ncbi:MAG: acyltransferase [Clostridia bacterium]|nr:acyltransferase [Clostridia bacterium]
MSDEKVYYRRLDILRIISCILILLYHLNLLPGGFLAVCTFFTLSGYLSCTSALKNNDFSIKKYYLNRLKKIYLPLLIVVLSTIVLAKVIPDIRWTNLKPESMSVIFGYNNFWQLDANLDYFTRHINSPFMHFWYIAILLQFEVVFPIAFVILKKISEKTNKHFSTIIVLLFTIISTALFVYMSMTQDIMAVYYNTFARCFSILFGVLLALIHNKYNLKIIRTIKKYNIIPFIIYIVILIGLCIFASTENYAIYMILTTILSIRLIEYSKNKSDKKSKVIDFISKSTYEIYLVQYPVIFFMNYISVEALAKTILAVLITIVISFIIHFLLNCKNNAVKVISILIFGAIIAWGGFLFIKEEDHTQEMKELEQRLNDNLKEIENKNAEYLNVIDKEKEEWNKILADMESGESKIKEMVTNLPVVGIGDSVLLAASPGLYKVFPNGYFDGKVSRTIVGGRELLSELIEEGKVGDTIILALANNGDYITKRNEAMMEVVGDRQVFWVNAVLADIPEFNDLFKEFAEGYSNLHIIDWEDYSKEHPEYFYADGIHVKGDGINAYANLVYDSIYNYYLEEYRNQFADEINEHEKEINEKTKLLETNQETLIEINNELENLKK